MGAETLKEMERGVSHPWSYIYVGRSGLCLSCKLENLLHKFTVFRNMNNEKQTSKFELKQNGDS